jgi:lysosomal Pro-X carboxypeptidase
MSLAYTTLYYNNTVSHAAPFHPAETYSQRYLINDDQWGKQQLTGSCPGPVFMYAGNEGPVTAFWDGNGFMQHLAEKYGGLLFFPEERYYGESFPTGDGTGTDFRHLTTQEVLEDYVEILDFIKAEYSAESCPVYAFGGSYGGTLAAYLRSAYPFAVDGALAASSELGYYDVKNWDAQGVTETTFSEIVAAQYAKSEGCLEAIWEATDAIEAASEQELLAAFNYCDADVLAPGKSSMFLYGLEGLPQQNYPYEIGDMPAWPVAATCAVLTGGDGDILSRAAAAGALSGGYSLTGDCLAAFPEGPGNVPGDGPGLTAWGYQSCTEALHEFSSHGREGNGIRLFDYAKEIGGLVDLCDDLYGLQPNAEVLTERYGGFDIARTTSNTIFSTGALDPWGGAGIKEGGADAVERGVHFIRLESGAHHLDLRGYNDADPADVTAARQQEEAIIDGWIQSWVEKQQKK